MLKNENEISILKIMAKVRGEFLEIGLNTSVLSGVGLHTLHNFEELQPPQWKQPKIHLYPMS